MPTLYTTSIHTIRHKAIFLCSLFWRTVPSNLSSTSNNSWWSFCKLDGRGEKYSWLQRLTHLTVFDGNRKLTWLHQEISTRLLAYSPQMWHNITLKIAFFQAHNLYSCCWPLPFKTFWYEHLPVQLPSISFAVTRIFFQSSTHHHWLLKRNCIR